MLLGVEDPISGYPWCLKSSATIGTGPSLSLSVPRFPLCKMSASSGGHSEISELMLVKGLEGLTPARCCGRDTAWQLVQSDECGLKPHISSPTLGLQPWDPGQVGWPRYGSTLS